jgi:hypothetical protein
MPKLLFSSEKWGCGATIELDNKDVVIVTIDRGELLVRKSSRHEGLLKSITESRAGQGLHRSKNNYKNAKMAEALDIMFPQKVPELSFKNPVLGAFAKAVWHCSSVSEVEKTLRDCEPPAEETWTSSWQLTDEYSFYSLALHPSWKETYIKRGGALYIVVLSDGRKVKKLLTKEEVNTWPARSNEVFEADNKSYRILRLETLDGVTVWEWRESG